MRGSKGETVGIVQDYNFSTCYNEQSTKADNEESHLHLPSEFSLLEELADTDEEEGAVCCSTKEFLSIKGFFTLSLL